LATLHDALVTVVRLLASAAPFISDAIHRRLTGTSVHLAAFPESEGRTDTAIDGAMDATRRLASLARAAREGAGLRVRQPLARMQVAVPQAVRGTAFDEFLDVLAAEINVRDIGIVASDEELVRLRAKPNFRSLGKRYGKDTPQAAASTARLTPDQLRDLEAGRSVKVTLDGRSFDYGPDDVVVERVVTTDWLVQSDGPYVAALDPHLMDELRQEGIAREIINRVQRLRKEAGYDYNTRIELGIAGPTEVAAAADAYRDVIGGETLARRLDVGIELPDPDGLERVDIDGREAVISVRRSTRNGV
jgi:isoleucyl-tRNA synthetase